MQLLKKHGKLAFCMENKRFRMTHEPVERLIAKLAVPTIISMLVTTFYNMADTYFVSLLDNTSITGAVGVVFSLMTVIQAFGFFFGHGSGNFISRALGSGNTDEAERMASVGFFCAMIAGACITVLGLIFLRPLAYLLGSTDTIYPYAKDYLAYILLGAPYMCASLVLNNQLRFQGNAVFAMIGLTSGAVLNCVLDPLLILGLDMGIRGAAIATIVSQFVSFLLLWIGVARSDNLKIRLRNFKPDRHYLLAILNGGAPSLCRQGIASLASICLNRAAGGFGDYAITAMSVCSRIMMFLNSSMIGFGQGFQPVCGFNYGAQQYSRVRRAFWFCVRVSAVFLVIVSGVAFAFAPQLVALFSSDPQVIDFGVPTLRYMAAVFPLNAWIVMCNMEMQTMGKAVRASFLAAARQGFLFIPLILILPQVLGAVGVQITQMVSDICTFLISIPLQISILKELRAPDGVLEESDARL